MSWRSRFESQLIDLEALGFDQCRILEPEDDDDTPAIRVRCSQCCALVINDTPTHEAGCPRST